MQRYDHLVGLLASPDRRSPLPRAVGATIAVAKLAEAIAAEQERFVRQLRIHDQSRHQTRIDSYGPFARRRCEVYVTSFAPGLLEARLELVAMLWRHHIRADLLYDGDWSSNAPSVARRESYVLVIVVKQAAKDHPLRVRSVLKASEEDGACAHAVAN